jgi:hypothetical protein
MLVFSCWNGASRGIAGRAAHGAADKMLAALAFILHLF